MEGFTSSFNNNGFGSIFGGFSIMFGIVFFLIIGVFVFVLVKGITQWNKNNQSPRLIVDAVLISKRTDISHHHNNPNNGAGMHSSTSTSYYLTFQFESGDRIEFHVTGQEYGLLVEGDRGKLTFQGTRYLGFARQ